MKRLQNILLFRELQFPLKQIRTILDSPEFDQQEALAQQIRLLELQLKHTQELILFARRLQQKGVNGMDFKAFDNKEMDQYEKEVQERWGNTKAYDEYRQKEKGRTDAQQAEIGSQLMERFAEIGKLRQSAPSEQIVQEKIAGIQAFITEHYYQCTKEILSGLGKMYVGDERMKRNIDKTGGDGTAEFVSQAIAVYCNA